MQKLAKGTLNCLKLSEIPVGVGTDCFKGGENLKHETDAEYARGIIFSKDVFATESIRPDKFVVGGQELLFATLANVEDQSITLILNSGLTDAATLFITHKHTFLRKIKSVAIMGGVKDVAWQGPDGVEYLQPDDAANNAFDWPSALYLYQALQEAKVPMTVFMRWAPYASQFPFTLYDRFVATGNPIGGNLLSRQKPAMNALWKACQSPRGFA